MVSSQKPKQPHGDVGVVPLPPRRTSASGGGGAHAAARKRLSSDAANRLSTTPSSNHTGNTFVYDDAELWALLGEEADVFADDNDDDEEEEKQGVARKPMTRQTLLNKIRQKKEVINKLRCQPWSMNRKRRTLRLAQKYLEQNESKVSIAHLYKEELIKRWRLFLRWAGNLGIYFIPWESKIKKIESQFGSVVSSYFTFLRWVIFMNFIITLIILSLVVVPELFADATADSIRRNRTSTRKQIPPEELSHADEFQVVWHYGGYLRYSPLFYGYYANLDFVGEWFRYPIPLAYFVATLFVFACSFIAILRKMALNARMSKLSGSKAEQYIFNWKVFTGWDYSIGNAETASNTAMAAVIKLRETINECQVEKSKKIRPIQVVIRIITNLVILAMIAFSIYCIYAAVQSSETTSVVEQQDGGPSTNVSLLTKSQVPSVVSTITHVFPIIFDLIGRIEKHHPKMQLRLHLIRVLTLYVINYATLIFALFEKLDSIRDISRNDDDTVSPTHAALFARDPYFILSHTTNSDTFGVRSPPVATPTPTHSSSRYYTSTIRGSTRRPRHLRHASHNDGVIQEYYISHGVRHYSSLSPQIYSRRPITSRFFSRNFVNALQLARFFTPTPSFPLLNESSSTYSRTNSLIINDSTTTTRLHTLTKATTISPNKEYDSNELNKRDVTTTFSGDITYLTGKSASEFVDIDGRARRKRETFAADETTASSLYAGAVITSTGPRRKTTANGVFATTFMPSRRPAPVPTVAQEKGAVTVDGEPLSIHAQFGPVGVNNPSALMRNATPSPDLATSYETRRLGPTPMPIFTPPPMPPTEAKATFLQQSFGPDWTIAHSAPTKHTAVETDEVIVVPSITYGDVVELDTIPYNYNGTEVPSSAATVVSAEYGDEGHYNDHICWETVIGQEIVKLVTMDLYYTILSILVIDFLRGYWIRCCSRWWCWDIETTFPEYGEFKVAENVLHIINNQGMIWLGLFFAPLLPAINNVKMIIVMYIRAWACMTCNVPAREIFRASRSSNFYLMILLLWLLLCTLPVGYVITSKRPSTICGPFAGKDQFYEVITDIMEAHVSKRVLRVLRYVASPGVIIPIILILILVIFFLFSLVRGLREANTDLQKQLVHERTEEKKKIFELAGGGQKKKTSSLLFGLGSGLAAKFQSRKPSQHLPEVERKRREPWRQYNGTDHASSLCPSDEPPSSINSPASEEAITTTGAGRDGCMSPPPRTPQQLPQLPPNQHLFAQNRHAVPKFMNTGGPSTPPPPSGTEGCTATVGVRSPFTFRPSLRSVDEITDNPSAATTTKSKSVSKHSAKHQQQQQHTSSPQSPQHTFWPRPNSRQGADASLRTVEQHSSTTTASNSNSSIGGGGDGGIGGPPPPRSTSSRNSTAAVTVTPQAAGTPEEIRSLIIPYYHFGGGSSTVAAGLGACSVVSSLAAFPRDTSLPVIFGTCVSSSGAPSSRRSSIAAGAATLSASAQFRLRNNSCASIYDNTPDQCSEGETLKVEPPDSTGRESGGSGRYAKVYRHEYMMSPVEDDFSGDGGQTFTFTTNVLPAAAPIVSGGDDCEKLAPLAKMDSDHQINQYLTTSNPQSTTAPGGLSHSGSSAAAALSSVSSTSRSASSSAVGGQPLAIGVGTPAPEAPQRISIYAREPRRVGGAMSVQQTTLSGSRINTTAVNVHKSPSPPALMKPVVIRGGAAAVTRPSLALPTSKRRQETTAATVQQQLSGSGSGALNIDSSRGKFSATNVADAFVPWPSIDEVKAQRANLFTGSSSRSSSKKRNRPDDNSVVGRAKRKTAASTATAMMSRSEYSATPSEPSARRNEPASDGEESNRGTCLPPRHPARFRISVSPTRRLRADDTAAESASESENEEEEEEEVDDHEVATTMRRGAPRRYIIKQQLMPGSTSSFGSRATAASAVQQARQTPETAAMRAQLRNVGRPVATTSAPRVEFGEDDSPRVEQPPSTSKARR